MLSRLSTSFALILVHSCGQVASSSPPSGSAPAPVSLAAVSQPALDTPAAAAAAKQAPFGDGEHAFAAIRASLLKRYEGTDVTEDDLYRAATQGMLEHIDAKRTTWNKLLSPDDVQALQNDLKGEVVGIGAEIDFEEATGYSDVLDIVPGSPAEKAGVQAGDRILDVDGKQFKGKTQKDVLSQIRGKAGETVTLNVLRGDRLVTVPIVRQRLSFNVVTEGMLPDSVGYVRIKSFNAKTRPSVDEALGELATGGARALVVDLRHNQGGVFDDALATADALLARGTTIVKVAHKGEASQSLTAPVGATKLGTVPMVVVVDGETASGGELLTAALRDGRSAEVIGQRTFGKWSIQTIDDLPNGYAAKYTVSLFHAPDGETYDGVGLTPDIEVDMDPKSYVAAERTKDLAQRILVDRQLRTALNLVKGK